MKILVLDLGGRPLNNDDLAVLQGEASAAATAPYTGRGAFILSGCEVSGSGPAYNVAAGLVFIDGELLRFYGAGAVTLPAQLQRGGFEVLDQRPYQTGGTKTCIRERVAVLTATDTTYASEYIPLDTWGGKTWDDVVRAAHYRLGDMKPVARINLNDYTDGVGNPGTEAWGWGLCDGDNDRANLKGAFPAGLDPARTDYDTVGNVGGAETVTLSTAQLPAHTHAPAGQFEWNQLLRKAPLNSNTTAAGVDGSGNGGSEPEITSSQPIQSVGSNQAHENRPPFYVVGWLQWVGY